jgi:hypothetical protein
MPHEIVDRFERGTPDALAGGVNPIEKERALAARRRARSATFWKMLVSATAGAALAIIVVVTVRDRHAGRNDSPEEAREPTPRLVDSSSAAAAEPIGAPTRAFDDTTGGDWSGSMGGSTTTTSAEIDAGEDATAVVRVPAVATAPPAMAPPVPPVETTSDAGTLAAPDAALATTAQDAGALPSFDAGTPRTNATDAGIVDFTSQQPWAPPSMSAGAGPFATEAPYWSASAFVSDPNAGAGRFATEAPPWAASAFVSDPNAGAGPFTTERNTPAFGVFPYSYALPLLMEQARQEQQQQILQQVQQQAQQAGQAQAQQPQQ